MENRLDAQLYNAPLRPTAMPVDGSRLLANLAQQRPVARARTTSGVARPASLSTPLASSSQPKRARKDRGPNWLPQEIAALIAAKRDMFLEELDTIDGRDLMTPDTSKWIRVSQEVMRAGLSPCLRDGPACKTKWNQLIQDYKRIADYLCRTGRNVPEYWELSSAERKAEGLPRLFAQEVFDGIHEWYGNRPQIQPPHVRDMLAPNDGNYRPQQIEQLQHEDEGDSEPETEDPMDMPLPHAPEATEDSTPPRSPRITSSTPSRAAGPTESVGTPSSRPFNGLPPGITPHVISSSETSGFTMKRRPGNTAVRRKSVSGHTVIAEATKATGEVMAQQMQDIAEASRELERSKIEVQLKLFSEQMAYQREKDRRLYENAAVANDNARLAIVKQGEMVSCLAHLSSVLSQSLTMTNGHVFPTMPHTAPRDVTTSPTHFYNAAPNFQSTPSFCPPASEHPGQPTHQPATAGGQASTQTGWPNNLPATTAAEGYNNVPATALAQGCNNLPATAPTQHNELPTTESIIL